MELNNEKEIKFHEDSLKIKKEIGDKTRESMSYTNLLVAYRNSGDFKKALVFYEKALLIFKKTNQFQYLKLVYENMSIAYPEMNNPEKAGEYERKAEELS